jgi:transcriptional regulator with XRE-family HTH domain
MKFPNNLYVLRSNKGLQQKEVSDAIGVGQSEYSKMERGDRKLGIHLDKLLEFFGVDEDRVFNTASPMYKKPMEAQKMPPLEDLPMFGLPLANGGEGFQVQKKMFTHCARPDYLLGVPTAYACFMLSNNMEQRYFYGEILFVDPSLQVKEKDFVVVQIKSGDRTVGLIRKVSEVTDRQYKLSTLSPDNTEVFKNSDIVAIHKIVGSRSNIE